MTQHSVKMHNFHRNGQIPPRGSKSRISRKTVVPTLRYVLIDPAETLCIEYITV